jgi:hypothetical protein
VPCLDVERAEFLKQFRTDVRHDLVLDQLACTAAPSAR